MAGDCLVGGVGRKKWKRKRSFFFVFCILFIFIITSEKKKENKEWTSRGFFFWKWRTRRKEVTLSAAEMMAFFFFVFNFLETHFLLVFYFFWGVVAHEAIFRLSNFSSSPSSLSRSCCIHLIFFLFFFLGLGFLRHFLLAVFPIKRFSSYVQFRRPRKKIRRRRRKFWVSFFLLSCRLNYFIGIYTRSVMDSFFFLDGHG